MKPIFLSTMISMSFLSTAFASEILGECKTTSDNKKVLLEEIQGYPSEGDLFRITISQAFGPEYISFQVNKSKTKDTSKAFSISDGTSFFNLDKATGTAEYKFRAVVWECWPGLGEWCVSKVPKWKTESVSMKDCSFAN